MSALLPLLRMAALGEFLPRPLAAGEEANTPTAAPAAGRVRGRRSATTKPERVVIDAEHDRDRSGRTLCGERGSHGTGVCNQRHPPPYPKMDKSSASLWQPRQSHPNQTRAFEHRSDLIEQRSAVGEGLSPVASM